MLEKSPSVRGESADTNSADTNIAKFPMEAMQTWWPMMSVAIGWNSKTFEFIMTLNKEWLDLMNRRLAEDMALQQHLGACNSFQGVCSAYADFYQTAVDDYQKKFAQIVKLGAGTVSTTMTDMQSRSEAVASQTHATARAA